MDETQDDDLEAARMVVRWAIRQALSDFTAAVGRRGELDGLACRVLAAIESRNLQPALAELAKDE